MHARLEDALAGSRDLFIGVYFLRRNTWASLYDGTPYLAARHSLFVIDPWTGGWGFDSNRDYLLPIPPEQITLNDKLTQNPGW